MSLTTSLFVIFLFFVYLLSMHSSDMCVIKQNSTEQILNILLASFISSMGQHTILQTERSSEELYKMKDFYGLKGTGSCSRQRNQSVNYFEVPFP